MADSPRSPGDASRKTPSGPKEPERRWSLGARLGFFVSGLALIVFAALVLKYSVTIGRAPWAWTSEDSQGFLAFSKERALAAKERVEEIDWSALKTKVTDETRKLWEQVPEVERRIDERLGRKPAAPEDPLKENAPRAPGVRPPGAYEDGLEEMRTAMGHYRVSPKDPKRLALAKKGFERAQRLLERAVKEEHDEKRRTGAALSLDECNKYLQDCRSREKG